MPTADAALGKSIDVVVDEELEFDVTPAVEHYTGSVLLQGNAQAAVSNLFLFPGAFGVSEIFEAMPPIDPNFVAVYALTSSYADNAPELLPGDINIPVLASQYLTEIQRRQAHGPYSFLGYSVGGIIAYEAARQVILRGEAVERIYLVDSPCPLVIPIIPQSLIRCINSATRTDQGDSDPQRKTSMTKPMSYMPLSLSPCSGHPIPRTTSYIAMNGLKSDMAKNLSDPSERNAKALSWLLDDRKGLGATGDGWERLVDRSKLKIVSVGGDHLSIMTEPHISDWVSDLRDSYWNSSFPFRIRSTKKRW